MRLSENKVVLITRKTRLEELIAKYNTFSQAKFYVEHLGVDFSDYVQEHENYQTRMREAEAILQEFLRVQIVDRSFLPNFLFGPQDVVVALGQDGLVANTLKYLEQQPLIGVNPDPGRWDGALLPFEVKDLQSITPEVMAGKRRIQEVTMAKARLNNGQTLYGVNDIFIGPKSHTSARYTIQIDDKEEHQSSSGVIVSTGLGSTGWLKSLLAGANAIAGTAASNQQATSMPWDADRLHFTVREPFPSKRSASTLVYGQIDGSARLTLVSQMPENGVIFSDGIEADYLEFNSGIVVNLGVAEKKGHLVI